LFWGLFAHESIGMLTCLGVAITIGGLLLLNLKARPAQVQRARSEPEAA
ncbi:MAG: hypothetical protein QOI94_915, partial [Acidobacteriaceae bacterium]|nr:hypothetical protein [Acidobacteriaceae bacterium]